MNSNDAGAEAAEPLAELIANLKPMNTPMEVAECSGIKIGTLARWRSMGVGPRFVKIGRTVHYPKEEIIRCLSENIYQSAGEAREGTRHEDPEELRLRRRDQRRRVHRRMPRRADTDTGAPTRPQNRHDAGGTQGTRP
ncbi:helix-turn-helix transcriptional regulator [Bifidobacterium platyrrhinorum]|uniref:helix-turn-helix transcriptional regulator n=1 Tax=Bifidobacterium platyrrhinorum TaxID=2661628 RepID=UPI001782ACC3|nr:hypothetical protein [Bifidobacterium platyrrhinorum]